MHQPALVKILFPLNFFTSLFLKLIQYLQ